MRTKPLTVQEKINIANDLNGSCLTASYMADKFDLDPFRGDLTINEAANEYGVWLCDDCGWWVEEDELADVVDGITCQDCFAQSL